MFYFLSLAAALFAIGMFGMLSRKTLLGKLVSLFVMSNSVILLFAAFNHYVQSDGLIGSVFLSFILMAIISELFLGAYLVYQSYTKPISSDDESINLFN